MSEAEAWAFLESDTRDAKDMLAYLEYEGGQVAPDDLQPQNKAQRYTPPPSSLHWMQRNRDQSERERKAARLPEPKSVLEIEQEAANEILSKVTSTHSPSASDLLRKAEEGFNEWALKSPVDVENEILSKSHEAIVLEPREPKKSGSNLIIVHLKAGLHWCASHLWSWTAILITAPLLYGLGVGAMYGQQPIIAACLYFFAVGLVVAKAITEARSHEQRIGVIIVILFLGTAVFGASLLWVRHTSPDWLSSSIRTRQSSVTTAPLHDPVPVPSPSAAPSPAASPKPIIKRSSKTDEQRRREQKALRDLHSK